MYAMNTQANGTFASNSSNEYNETTLSNSGIKGQYITPNVHPTTSLKRPYPVHNVPTSSNLSRLTPIKPKFSQHDIIQIRTPGCWINFRAEQLNILPLAIDPSSLVRLSGNSLEPNFNNVISLCDNEPPNYSAALAVTQPTTVEMTPELRNLLAQLPPTVIELLPECCREKQAMKPVFADESAINVRRQRLSRGMFAPLILWPDGSIYKEDLPTCTKHPRYIYTTLDASVGHLVEYILKRTEIEANWNQRDKYTVEITHLDEEKDEVVLLLSSKTKECFNQPGLESAEFLSLKVDEGLFNTMIAISQPFKALSPMLTVADLFKHYHPNKKRPLKVVYRFVQNEG
uniref:Uncharacterized protein n=1 Tax=Acrobeloides nanus TaxID=290746 RepID=A0A914EAT2_9BILA